MEIKDNHSYSIEEFVTSYPELYQKLTNKTLRELTINDNLLIFPPDFSDSEDLEEKNLVLEQINHQVKTGNIVGFLGYGDEKLMIQSRFSASEDNYFLHYLLQKVLKLNLVDLPLDFSFEEHLYHLLIYLFPKYLSNALAVGLYKEYRNFHFNDSKIKGTINIAQHIKDNTPFQGNIAYDTRHLSYDNPVLQLVRHTIEFLGKMSIGRHLLSEFEVKKQVDVIRKHTPSYQINNGQALIKNNKRNPVRHSYYKTYRQLQQLCLMILARQKHDFKKSSNKIYGILFDVSWLWEEYLSNLLPDEFIHPENRKSIKGISLFSDRVRTVYPDFYTKDKRLVLDAKYKKFEISEKGIGREDLYQLISYSYILQSQMAGVLYPSTLKKNKVKNIGKLNGYSGQLVRLPFHIPQYSNNFREFQNNMILSEKIFIENIKDLI